VQPNDDPLALHASSERAEVLITQDGGGNQLKESNKRGTSYYFPENRKASSCPVRVRAARWQRRRPESVQQPGLSCGIPGMGRNERGADVGGWTTALLVQQRAVRRRQPGSAREVDRSCLPRWSGTRATTGCGGAPGAARKFALVLMGIAPVAAGKDFYINQSLYRGTVAAARMCVGSVRPRAV